MAKLALRGGKPLTRDFLGTSQLKFRPELEKKYLLDVIDRGPLDDWPGKPSQSSKFAEEFAEFLGAKFCSLLTNGTHTLQVALESLDIGAGDEVIVPGMTWQATASVCVDINAVPVMVDVEPDTLCIDPAKIEQAITPATRAIMPVHLYHRMANMDRILAIAKKHKLHVIEDSAHAHGCQWNGKGAGSMGVFGSFSFQGTKLMRSGEGGALVTSDEDLYWRTVSQRSCGREFPQRPGVKVHSGNYRMTALQAAILRGQLAALKRNAPLIDRNGLALDEAIAAAPGVKPMRRDAKITRQAGYCLAFQYDKTQYDGLPGKIFRKALSAELNWEFLPPYTPLSHSEMYYPHTKKRHQTSQAYLKAITPSRWKLPVADAMWTDGAVIALWQIYGLAPGRAHLLTDAIAKIHANRQELLDVADSLM